MKGIVGEVYATDFDWLRRRIGFTYGPETVFVRNIGTANVKINSLGIEPGADADQFTILNEPDVRGKVLGPNEEVQVKVQFNPTTTGQKQARIVYQVDPSQTNEVVSVLRGFGTQPELFTTDYDFGSMLVETDPTTKSSTPSRMPRSYSGFLPRSSSTR